MFFIENKIKIKIVNFFQAHIHPHQKDRFAFLGYWIVSLIFWSFMMNISLIIVIVFSIIGHYLLSKPLAALFFIVKNILKKNYFNNLDIFEAYYAGFELGRIVRIITKSIYFIIIFLIARISMYGYLSFIS